MAHFVDTNIVVYAYGGDEKTPQAVAVLIGAKISVQVLNEFSNVALRKLGYSSAKLETRITAIRSQVAEIAVLDESSHDLARVIVARYKLSFYDSVLIATALLADCDTFYSEDLQHGLLIEDQLRIINPFV